MKKSTRKRPLAEEASLTDIINHETFREDFKTAKMMLEDQAPHQPRPLFEYPQQPVDVIAVAPVVAPQRLFNEPAIQPMVALPAVVIQPAAQQPTSQDQLIAHIRTKNWQFWGHVNPLQEATSAQSWTDYPTSREVQILKDNSFRIRSSLPNAKNAAGSKVVHWVCKTNHGNNIPDFLIPIKMCPFEKTLFSTEIVHAQAIAANNTKLMPLVLVVRADLQAKHYTISEILSSYLSTPSVSLRMPVVWVMKNGQLHEFTAQTAQQFLIASDIKSQLGAKSLSPISAEKVRKHQLAPRRTPSPSSESSSIELKRAETDDDLTHSRTASLDNGLPKPNINSQSQKKSSQKTPANPKQMTLTHFFARPSKRNNSMDVAPQENQGSQPESPSPL